MTVQTPITAAAIQARLYFLKPMTERLVSYQYEPPAGVPQRNGEDEAHLVTIRDARPLAGGLSLDVEGFALLAAPSGFAAFGDSEEIRRAY